MCRTNHIRVSCMYTNYFKCKRYFSLGALSVKITVNCHIVLTQKNICEVFVNVMSKMIMVIL